MTDASSAEGGAYTVIKECLDLTAGANLLLLTDEAAMEVIDPFFSAARECGVRLTTLFYSRDQQLTLDDLGPLARTALDGAEAAVLAHTADDACSRFRNKLVSEWRGSTRLATMPGANRQVLAMAARSNYSQMAARCEQLTPPLLNGKVCELTTYDSRGKPYVLRFELGGVNRIPVHSVGLLRESAWGNVPSGEIFTAPIEESADGEYLVNGSIGQSVIGDDPAVLTFERGRLVGHRFLGSETPVPYLSHLEEVSRQRNDGGWNVIAEFGIGVNDGIDKVIGIPLIDEKVLGTIHIALGNNVGWQGKNSAQIHLDMITWHPDVVIDDTPVLRRGVHLGVSQQFDDLLRFASRERFAWPEQAVGVRLQQGSFERGPGDQFFVSLPLTQSGKITRFPLANPRTAHAARALSRLGRTELANLAAVGWLIDALSVQESKTLLEMLWSYGVLKPSLPGAGDDGLD